MEAYLINVIRLSRQLQFSFLIFIFGREKELWHTKILSPSAQQHQSHRNYLQDNDASKTEALYNYDVSFKLANEASAKLNSELNVYKKEYYQNVMLLTFIIKAFCDVLLSDLCIFFRISLQFPLHHHALSTKV